MYVFGWPELIFTVVSTLAVVGWIVLPAWGVLDAARRPGESWRAAGRSRGVWIAALLLLGGFGAVPYFAVVRPGFAADRRSHQYL